MIDSLYINRLLREAKKKAGIHKIPKNDPKTYSLINRNQIVCPIVLHNKFRGELIKAIHIQSMEDLQIFTALYKPHYMISLKIAHTYGKRKSRKYSFGKLDIDEIRKPLVKTNGMIFFFEQRRQIIQNLTGWSENKSEKFRGKLHPCNKNESKKNEFFNQLDKKGFGHIKNEILNFLFSQKSTDGLSWCRKFAKIIYEASYFKCHLKNEYEELIQQYNIRIRSFYFMT